jgi:Endonuclease-reverse transcriptase
MINCGNNFEVFRKDRHTRGGGICFLVSKRLSKKVTLVNIPAKYSELEILAIDINYLSSPTRLTTLVYRPPGLSYDRSMNVLLSDCLQMLTRRSINYIVLGDFNLPGIDWQGTPVANNSSISELVEFLADSGLQQIVNFTTREDSILDLVFMSEQMWITDPIAAPPISTSDHNCVIFSCYLQVDLLPGVDNAKTSQDSNIDFCFKKADWLSFNTHIACTDWQQLFHSCLTVDEYWSIFHRVLFESIVKFVPKFKTNAVKVIKKRYPAFLRKLNSKKSIAWKKYARSRTPHLKLKYKAISTRYKASLANFVSLNEVNLVKRGNLGSFYKYINGKTSSRSNIPALIDRKPKCNNR